MMKNIRKRFESGGSIESQNKQMFLSNIKSCLHHADEINQTLFEEIEGWVLAKSQRAATSLSDVAHFFDGQQQFAQGGVIKTVDDAVKKLESEGLYVTKASDFVKKKGFDWTIGRDFETAYTETGHPYNDSWGVNLTDKDLIGTANGGSLGDYLGKTVEIEIPDSNEAIVTKVYRQLKDAVVTPMGVWKSSMVKMARGGQIDNGNMDMFLSNINAVKHHANEIMVSPIESVPAWVLSMSDRAASDLSDVAHYLAGEKTEAMDVIPYELIVHGEDGQEFIEIDAHDESEALEIAQMKYLPEHVMMSHGGVFRKSLEKRAQESVGDDVWYSLDERTRAGVVSEIAQSEIGSQKSFFAEGGVMEATAVTYKVKYDVGAEKPVEKTYKTKGEMEDDIAEMYMSHDVQDVDIQEVFPAPPKEEEPKKKNLFQKAEEKAPKKSSSKDKEQVIVEGIESQIMRYDELKAIIDNATAEKELIGGKLKEIGKEEFLRIYSERNKVPENFDLADGDQRILFIVMDKYKKVEPEKVPLLKELGGLLEEVTTYTFNNEVLDRVGDIVSDLIMGSDKLTEKDKEKLLVATKTTAIKKGSIDRLMDYEDPDSVFVLIEPILALK